MQRDLTKGSVFQNIIFFSLPFLLSYFLQTLYGLADLFIVGQFNGADIISAVSIGSQLMHMITVIIVGLAMGSTVMIGRYVGGKDKINTSKTIGNTITLFLVFSLALSVCLIIVVNCILKVMSVPYEAVEQTRIYLIICFAGIPFITAYNIISAVFRGMGDSKSPMYFIIIACAVNIVLDYIFIGIFDMKASGAALGTVLSQTISVITALISISRRNFGIGMTAKDLKPDFDTMLNIIKIGLPVACQDGFIQITFLVITIIANRRGVDVAAAVGVVEKIISILFLVHSSMLSAISAIAAQNMGAGLHDRAALTLKYGVMISVSVGILCFIVSNLFSNQMLSLFSKDTTVIMLGSQYLKSYAIDCIFAGIHFCFNGYFCAYGLSIVSFAHNVISALFIRIPGAYLASKLFPNTLYPMGLAAPMGSLLSAVICFGVYIWLKRKKKLG